MKRTVAVTVFVVVVVAAALGQRVQINRPTLQPANRNSQEYLDDQFLRAIAIAEAVTPELEIGYQGFSQSRPISGAQIRIDVTAMQADGQSYLILNGTGRGQPITYPYMLPWGEMLHTDLAVILAYLGDMLAGPAEPTGTPPVHILSFSTAAISTADLAWAVTPYPSMIAPYGEDSLLIGSNSYAIVTDLLFRERGKIGIDRPAADVWASYIGGTPGGSIVGTGIAGTTLSRYVEGIDNPYRIPIVAQAYGLLVMSDGTVIIKDVSSNLLRVEGTRVTPLELEGNQTAYISFLERGPEDTIWVWDATLRGVLIYGSDGTKLGFMLPHMDQSEAGQVRFLAPYPDGGLLVVTYNGIHRFARNGTLVWSVENSDIPRWGPMTSYMTIFFDPRNGTISFVNMTGGIITQLLDVEYLEQTGGLTEMDRELVEIGRGLDRNPADVDLFIRQAQFFESVEAWELALSTWTTASGLDPTNREASAGLRSAEIRNLRTSARRAYERTIRILDELGPANAQDAYYVAQRIYEQLFSRDPNDQEARRDYDNLVELFTSPTSRPQPGPLQVRSIEIPDLFPALLATYQESPPGELEITNPGDQRVEEIRVTVESHWLDFPAVSRPLDSLEPGATAILPIPTPFDSSALTLREDIPLPVHLTIRYRVGTVAYEIDETPTALLHRATALTWDRSEKLAPFFTPNEDVVQHFAFSIPSVGSDAEAIRLSSRIFRAARLSDAVGTYGIEYTEDPTSGISEILGSTGTVDTVRFARDTLRYHAGDCDDTTALMGSLLEALGIPTAIMTSPGHVFLAFDTGEPAVNAWLFESDDTTAIVHGGTVWLPYETTILDQGFMASWKEGSRLYRQYNGRGEIEFLPIAEQRDEFPALAIIDLPSFEPVPPPAEIQDAVYNESLAGIRTTIYETQVARLEGEMSSRSSRAQVRLLNQLGILHSVFDETREAERSFERAVDLDPDYTASYINLANLELLANDPVGALRYLDEVDERNPNNSLAVLLRAKAESLRGNRPAVAEQMTILREIAPELASNYEYLDAAAGSRASEAQGQGPLPWATEE
jgi:tetratricopeptide (TPR) repeat protein